MSKPCFVYLDHRLSQITHNSTSCPIEVHCHLHVVGLMAKAGEGDTDGQEMHVIFGRG